MTLSSIRSGSPRPRAARVEVMLLVGATRSILVGTPLAAAAQTRETSEVLNRRTFLLQDSLAILLITTEQSVVACG